MGSCIISVSDETIKEWYKVYKKTKCNDLGEHFSGDIINHLLFNRSIDFDYYKTEIKRNMGVSTTKDAMGYKGSIERELYSSLCTICHRYSKPDVVKVTSSLIVEKQVKQFLDYCLMIDVDKNDKKFYEALLGDLRKIAEKETVYPYGVFKIKDGEIIIEPDYEAIAGPKLPSDEELLNNEDWPSI